MFRQTRWPPGPSGSPSPPASGSVSCGPAPRSARSISRSLQPLWEVADISWFSLQAGDRSGDIALLEAVKITDLSPWLTDFAETAAALSHLDLVITVDTSVAHLAGALGRPTWVLLPYAPDWRWLLDREDSPWYPTARLFRQKTAGDWPDVAREVAAALAPLAADASRSAAIISNGSSVGARGSTI